MPDVKPLEPVLPMSDIQGIAVPGFLKPYQAIIGIACPDQPAAISNLKLFLTDIANLISDAEHTLKDRRRFRELKKGGKSKPAGEATKLLSAVAFTFVGLQKLTPGAAAI